jgi:hypothetical protein
MNDEVKQANDEVKQAEALFNIYLDIQAEMAPSELRQEAMIALALARNGCSHETIKMKIVENQVRRLGHFMDLAACDGLAGEILRLTQIPGAFGYLCEPGN